MCVRKEERGHERARARARSWHGMGADGRAPVRPDARAQESALQVPEIPGLPSWLGGCVRLSICLPACLSVCLSVCLENACLH
jgi:hypothetical protein